MDSAVDEYINKQRTSQKEICQKIRKIILDVFPDIQEEMMWGVPTYGDGKYYIVSLKDHVNVGFSIKGLTTEDYSLFDGGGKTMKVISVYSPESIDKNRIIKLLKLIK